MYGDDNADRPGKLSTKYLKKDGILVALNVNNFIILHASSEELKNSIREIQTVHSSDPLSNAKSARA
jgi:hypothetical protein